MNSIRNKIIGAAITVAILMGAFPPWSQTAGPDTTYPGVTFSLGYAFIFDAPMIGSISFGRLLLQWLLVAALTAVAIRYEEKMLALFQLARTKIRKQTERPPDQHDEGRE